MHGMTAAPDRMKISLSCVFGKYLIAKKQFQVIHHKFPEPGHSYQQTALSTRLRVTLRLYLLQVLIHQILMCVHAYLNIFNTSVTMQRLPKSICGTVSCPFPLLLALTLLSQSFKTFHQLSYTMTDQQNNTTCTLFHAHYKDFLNWHLVVY